MLRHSRGLPGLRAGLQRILACCGLALLFSASPSFAQSTAGLKSTSQTTSAAQQVQLEGELEVLHEDYPNKTGKYKYFLHSAQGERHELKFKGRAPQHPSGTKLRVKGAKSGNVLYLDSSGDSGVQVLTLAAAPNTFGEQRTLVMLVNFQDQPANKPWTFDQVRNMVFGSTSDYFRENSYQQTWLAGDVYGWYTLPLNSTVCDQLGIASYAKQAATAAGINLSNYTRYVYMFPKTTSCSWLGTGSVGGSPSQAWINGELTLKVIGHEMGHNIGLHHSHSLACNGATLGTNCAAVEYGDGADLMGWSSSAHFNAFQKEFLGWLNNGVMPPIATVGTSGTYVIDPYETPGSNPKALKIPKGIDPLTGKKVWYYVEYRQAIGFDSVLANGASLGNNFLSGVLVRTGSPEESGNTSYLLDMTAETYSAYSTDPALVVGKSFSDPDAGLVITPLWVNGTNAGVEVTLSNSTCTRTNPAVLVSPSLSPSVAAGTPVTYTVAVTNNDSSSCGSSTFNLQGSVPSGWNGALAASVLAIGGGNTSSTTFTVTSPGTAVAGSYGIGVSAANSANGAYSSNGSASYVVGSTSSSQAPVALADSAATPVNTGVTVPVLANDYDPAGKPLVIKSVGQASRGVVVINSDGTITYSPKPRFKGTDSFTYTISNGNASASATVTVQVQQKGGGK